MPRWQDFCTAPNINYVYILLLKVYSRLPFSEVGKYDSGACIMIMHAPLSLSLIDVWGCAEIFPNQIKGFLLNLKLLSIISEDSKKISDI